jgi:hypothetical protein
MTMKPLCPVYFVESSLFGAAVHLTSAHDKYSALHVTTTIPEQTPRSWSVVDIMPPFSRLTDTKFLAQVHKKVLGQRAEKMEWRKLMPTSPTPRTQGQDSDMDMDDACCTSSVSALMVPNINSAFGITIDIQLILVHSNGSLRPSRKNCESGTASSWELLSVSSVASLR